MYLTVKQCALKYPFIPMGGLRYLIFTDKEFENAVVRRIGRKILIDEQAFLNFINNSE